MPAIAHLAHFHNVPAPADLAAELRDLVDARRITRTQLVAIVDQVRDRLPADVTLAQRSPLGVLYVTARSPAGETSFTLNHRAKVIA